MADSLYFIRNNWKLTQLNQEVVSGSVVSGLLSTVHRVTGLIPSNISVGPSVGWYIPLTPFETIFLHLVIFQLLLLRYLQLLPVNVNDFVNGMNLFGRRKRSLGFTQVCQRDEISETFFKLLRQLDKEDCGVRTLCELESANNLRTPKISEEAVLILSALRVSRKRKLALEKSKACGSQSETEPWAITPFEEAVFLGSAVKYKNSTLCETQFNGCPLKKQDIHLYVNQIFGVLN